MTLLVVDDGGTYGTGSIFVRLEPEFARVTVLAHAGNAGSGAGLRTGIAHAHFMDSDVVLARLRDGRFALRRPANYHVDIRRSYCDDRL